MTPRICVYTISLNEINNVDGFVDSCQGADLVLVADTGSTDGTVERLRDLGVRVHSIQQTPWRFDHARQQSLDLIPQDIDLCISIDLDERLPSDWRSIIDSRWTPSVNRISYDYVWSWTSNGDPDGRFTASKIHSRQGYTWKYPCHEVLVWTGAEPEVTLDLQDLQIQHHADNTKPRTQYLGLLRLGRDENPNDERMCHYYARELMYHGFWDEAIMEFERHLTLAHWREERCASQRYVSQCHRNQHRYDQALTAAIRASLEWNTTREPWMEVVHSAYALQDWVTVYWAATKALAITKPSTTYKTEAINWGSLPWDMAALAAYQLGFYTRAVELGEQALAYNPQDSRLVINLQYYQQKIVL